jgi:flagellar basal-body rod protein FlgG
MSNGIYAAISGAKTQMYLLDTIANNLANVNTPGYKADKPSFKETLDGQRNVLSKFPRDTIPVDVAGVVTDFSQGPLEKTDNSLDVALNGPGFFAIKTDAGDRLTRNGNFFIDKEQNLVTSTGSQVYGQNGPITFRSDKPVTIDPTGQIFQEGAVVDKIRVVNPPDVQSLSKSGDSLYEFKGKALSDLPAADKATVQQGFLESSNVSSIGMMNEMIRAQRTFDMTQRMLQSHSELDKTAARKIGIKR